MKSLKITLAIVMAFAVSLSLSSMADANNLVIDLKVEMKSAYSISAKLVEIESVKDDKDIWGLTQNVTGTATLNFTKSGRDLEKTTDGVYLTGYYYALEVSPVGGGWTGTQGINIGYSGDTNKNIADHATMTLVRAEYTGLDTDPDEIDLYRRVRFDHAAASNIPTSDLIGGWLRVYLGLATGETDEPSDVTPFTDGTEAGTYSGTLTLSYTGQ